jgi:hypothetical protein
VRGFLPDRLRTVSGLSSRPAIFQWPDQRLPGPPASFYYSPISPRSSCGRV